MIDYGKKAIKVDSIVVDINMLEDLSEGVGSRELYCRPLMVAPDKRLGILYKDRVYPLYLDENGSPIIVKGYQSYESNLCETALKGSAYNIPYVLPPKGPHVRNRNIRWELISNQFGLYIYIDAPDYVVEELVFSLTQKGKYNVVSWDSTHYISESGITYQWFVELSSGLSDSRIRAYLFDFFSALRHEELGAKESDLLKGQVARLRSKLNNVLKLKEGELNNKKEEIENAYYEINRLKKLLDAREEKISGSPDNNYKNKAKELKRTLSEKIVSNIIFSLYQNLALSPDAPRLVIAKFENSRELWSLLSSLDRGENVAKKTLNGLAGKMGWKEVVKHISTGTDSRGRMYIRESKGDHKFDVVIHWKQNSTEQSRMIRKLCSFNPFGGPEVVLK